MTIFSRRAWKRAAWRSTYRSLGVPRSADELAKEQRDAAHQPPAEQAAGGVFDFWLLVLGLVIVAAVLLLR